MKVLNGRVCVCVKVTQACTGVPDGVYEWNCAQRHCVATNLKATYNKLELAEIVLNLNSLAWKLSWVKEGMLSAIRNQFLQTSRNN